MDAARERPAPRVRERSGRPARAPWIYRCRLTGPNATVDVDAFGIEEAAAAAAAHWDVECGEVAVDGQRRSWMRWMPFSTHDARDGLPMERNWWYATRLGAVIVAALVAAYAVHTTLLS